MEILSKNIEMSNVITIFKDSFFFPEAPLFMSLFNKNDLSGSHFADDPVMRVRMFEFPQTKFKYIFERNRFRIEDYGFRDPKDSQGAAEMHRIISALYPGIKPVAYGFNYDAILKLSSVIPQQEIMGHFLREESLSFLKDFGWQYTLEKEKGKKLETYFLKAVSPIELRIHANHHFNEQILPSSRKLQEDFEKCYSTIHATFKQFLFGAS
jgi:hypothetical protein